MFINTYTNQTLQYARTFNIHQSNDSIVTQMAKLAMGTTTKVVAFGVGFFETIAACAIKAGIYLFSSYCPERYENITHYAKSAAQATLQSLKDIFSPYEKVPLEKHLVSEQTPQLEEGQPPANKMPEEEQKTGISEKASPSTTPTGTDLTFPVEKPSTSSSPLEEPAEQSSTAKVCAFVKAHQKPLIALVVITTIVVATGLYLYSNSSLVDSSTTCSNPQFVEPLGVKMDTCSNLNFEKAISSPTNTSSAPAVSSTNSFEVAKCNEYSNSSLSTDVLPKESLDVKMGICNLSFEDLNEKKITPLETTRNKFTTDSKETIAFKVMGIGIAFLGYRSLPFFADRILSKFPVFNSPAGP